MRICQVTIPIHLETLEVFKPPRWKQM